MSLADISRILHNRPKTFIAHCKERPQLAACIEEENVVQNADGTFPGNSLPHGRIRKTSFGNDTELSNCQYFDWDTCHLPCKYFMPVMKSLHADREDFLEKYRNSVYSSLDQEI